MFLPFLVETPPKQQISIQNRIGLFEGGIYFNPSSAKLLCLPAIQQLELFRIHESIGKNDIKPGKSSQMLIFPIFNGMLSVYIFPYILSKEPTLTLLKF